MPNLFQIFGKSSETSVFALSDKAFIGDNSLNTNYTYQNAFLDQLNGQYTVKPTEVDYKVNLDLSVSKNGLFLIGSGGNNDSTLTAICNAIRHNISFQNKNDPHEPNFFGPDIEATFMKLRINFEGKHVYASFKEFASTLSLYDFVIGGWDISKANIKEVMVCFKVIHNNLQRQVGKYLEPIVPLPSVYYPDFIAANQEERADNVIPGTDKWAHVEHIRKDIHDFKEKNELDRVVVL